jgi:hypothetical protein
MASKALDKCRETSTNPLLSCKTNPILSASGGFKTLYLAKTYAKNTEFCLPKAKPNKPNQTQSKANFSAKNAAQSQNKPKQTQFLYHWYRVLFINTSKERLKP